MLLLINPLGAASSLAEIIPILTPSKSLLALGAGGWGISDTVRVVGAAELIFLVAMSWVVLLKLRTRQQNALLKSQLLREKAFSELGRKLAAASVVSDAARIILDAADGFFGWDAAYLHLYSAERDSLEPVMNLDTVAGKRTEVPFGYPAGKPTPMARQIIKDGATLLRRVTKAEDLPELLPFGNAQKRPASLMFVPVHGTSEIIGLLSIQSYTPDFYDEENLALLQGLADHCGGALERIRARADLHKSIAELEQRVSERTSELTRLNGLLQKGRDDLEKVVDERTANLTKAVSALEQEIAVRRLAEARSAAFSRLGGKVVAAVDFTTVGQVALDAADELLRWDAAYLHLYTPDYRHTIPILSYDVVEEQRAQVFYLHPEVSARDKLIIEHGAELVVGPGSGTQAAFVPFGVLSRPSAARLFVPIHSREKVIGAMSIQSYTENAYSQDDLVLLQALADFCGGTLERIQAEQRLRQSEERFSKVFRSSPTPMSVTTLEQGTYLDVNDSLTALLGFTREEMLGRTSIELGIWPDPEARLKMAEFVLHRKSVRNFQCQMRAKHGEIRFTVASIERLDFQGEQNIILATFHDNTESLDLEAQLRQSQKMEAIGQLAAGVAHDFNNILTIIQGHIGLLLDDASLPATTRESLEPVATAADRAASLTRQLLAFSRKQVMRMRLIDLNDLVGDTASMLQRLLGEVIVLSFNYSSSPAVVQGDTAMLEQVIINLAVNARDAMPEGGRLALGVEPIKVALETARHRTEMDATDFICLTISDTGIGMDEPTKARIFEPFFTTKGVGRGTGLGLATVYGIVKQHHGWIDVESVPGKGTVFRVFLMACADAMPVKEVEKEAEPVAPKAGSRQGGETILVVEDEEDLRELVDSLLQTFGYRVLLAEHGKDAIEVWKKAEGKIDLLLTDITMPEGISGLELAEVFRKEKPALKVVFSSGYSVELFERKKVDGLREGLNFLPKPYQPETLAQTVRQCLDS